MKIIIPLLIGSLCQFLQAEPKSIFNGSNLAGWYLAKNSEKTNYRDAPGNFLVQDKALVCVQLKDKKGAIILSEGAFKDFELSLEFKNDWGCDSGVILRSNSKGEGIQVMNDYLEDGSVGFLFGQGTGGFISRPFRLTSKEGRILAKDKYDGVEIDGLRHSLSATEWNKTWKPNDWNHLKVRCVGENPLITTWINDVKVMEMDGAVYKARSLKSETVLDWSAPSAWKQEKIREITGGEGHIGFQVHPGRRWKNGGSVQYRKIKIKDLTHQ